MTDKLKPCPFCGSEAEVYEYNEEETRYDPDTLGFLDSEEVTRYGCGCPGCGCMLADKPSRKTAIKCWNRRFNDE